MEAKYFAGLVPIFGELFKQPHSYEHSYVDEVIYKLAPNKGQ